MAGHLHGCEACAAVFRRTRDARGLLRTELIDLVDGREPQLWPALREQLQAEGLFKQAASGAPDGGALSNPTKLEPAAALAPIRTHPRWRKVAGLAAGVAAVFVLGKMTTFGGGAGLGSPAVAGGGAVEPADATDVSGSGRGGFGGTLVSNGAVGADLDADSLLAGAGDAGPVESTGPMPETSAGSGALRPVGFDEQSLGDIARENLRREREAGQMFYRVVPNPGATKRSGVGLVSSYSLQ